MPTSRINQENENLTHFLTITIIEWIDIFTKPEYFQIIIDSLKYCGKNKGLLLYEYVIMTNHLHLIARAKEEYKLSQIISDFKKHTTREILKELEKDNRRYILNLINNSFSKKKGYDNQIWQRENYPELIESEKFYIQKANYIYSGSGNLIVENKIYLSGDNENMPRHSCPTGWVLVPGNSDFGTEDFCVMKYEAKKDATTKNPTSVAAGTPWVSVSQYEAKNACTRIGAHLMTDAEWMTVARNAELVAGNWSSEVVGTGNLARGWAASTSYGDTWTNTVVAPSTDADCLYNWEWTDALCDTTSWHNGGAWEEWNDGDLTDYEQIVGGSTVYTSVNGVGQYYGCTASGNAFRRGGYWDYGSNAGVFTLALSRAPASTGADIGFRCAR